MKFFETIKDYFAPAYSSKFANPVEDAKLLSALCRDSLYLRARNGKSYYYYFPHDEGHIDIAKHLFLRNGVNINNHESRYYCEPYESLRILDSKLKKNSQNMAFIGAINSSIVMKPEELQSRIKTIYVQMKGGRVK